MHSVTLWSDNDFLEGKFPKNSLDLVLVKAEVLKAVILCHRVEIQPKIWKDGLVDMTKEAMTDCTLRILQCSLTTQPISPGLQALRSSSLAASDAAQRSRRQETPYRCDG
jgi:hypothetical protein